MTLKYIKCKKVLTGLIAVKVTRRNFNEIRDTFDCGDGVLSPEVITKEEAIGCYVVTDETSGNQLVLPEHFKKYYVRCRKGKEE